MTTVFEDIIFMEESCPADGEIVGDCEADLTLTIGAHLKTLDDVKRELAKDAKKDGCNCICSFAYGQKTSVLTLNNVSFYGSGSLVRLPEKLYNDIKKTV